MFVLQTGNKIKGGGIWVIGQDQDSLGGSFDAKDSFKGILTEVNIWNTVLGVDEIKSFANDCDLLMQGNYKAYSDFDISRATQLIKLSYCHFAPIPEA
jgi:CUB/sushi domain-containing protein